MSDPLDFNIADSVFDPFVCSKCGGIMFFICESQDYAECFVFECVDCCTEHKAIVELVEEGCG